MSKTPPFLFSVRFFLTIMAFFGYCVQYMLKINMGIGIVCMINNTAVQLLQQQLDNPTNANVTQLQLSSSLHAADETGMFANQTSGGDEDVCLFKLAQGKHSDGQFVWTKSIQGLVLASYFYGYLISQLPGGWLSMRFGGKNVLGISMLIASLMTILTPFAARWHYAALFVNRFLIGLFHGVHWPAMSSIWVEWAPTHERSKMIGSSTAGAWIGNIVGLSFGGYLCANGFDGGWPSIFYIFGIIGTVWSVIFLVFISDSPKDNRFISSAERDYLLYETRMQVSAKQNGQLKTPWKAILMSKVCWATIIAHFTQNWGNYFFLTQLPSYMKDVLKFDTKSNGLMSSLPYVACALCTGVFAFLTEAIIRKQWLKRNSITKLFSSLGLLIPMAALICIAFVTCSNPYLAVAGLVIALGFAGFYWCHGPLVNINNIAGSYAGIVFGITNTFGTLPGVIGPYIVGVITKNQTQSEWKIVFFIGAAIYFVGAVVFLVFAQSDLQPWAYVPEVPLNSTTTTEEKDPAHAENMHQRMLKYESYHAKFISKL